MLCAYPREEMKQGIEKTQHNQRGKEADIDSQSSKPGNGMGMDLSPVGMVESADALRKFDNPRSHDERQRHWQRTAYK